MIDPYKMIVVNLISSSILLTGILFYYFVYPKKKPNLFVLLVLISLLPITSIFRAGVYESGDYATHVYRTIAFYQSLSEGQILPSWAGNLNAHYGYPLFIFLNPLPYYVGSLFHVFGFSFITSVKVHYALSYVLSGIFFYLWAKHESKNTFAAFAGAIVYLFTPYHLVDLHFRNAIGEVTFFAVLPLFFYCFSRFKEEKNLIWLVSCSLSFSLLFFAHQAMAVFSAFIIIPYVLLSAWQTKTIIKSFLFFCIPLIIGFFIAAYTWIPHLVYPQYTLANLLSNKLVQFPPIQDLLYSPWRLGFLFQGPMGQLSYFIGYTQLLLIIVSMYFLLKHNITNKTRSLFSMWIGVNLFLIFMITPAATNIWQSVPILNTAEFSSRLLLLVCFSLGALAMYCALLLKKHTFLISLFLLITIGYTMLNWGNRRVIPEINDTAMIANLPKSTYEGEGFCCMGQPKWTQDNSPWMATVPNRPAEIIEGKGTIQQVYRDTTHHTYVLSSQTGVTIKEHTWYFPGWELFIDGKKHSLTFSTGKEPGMMLFSTPPGLHKVELRYEDLIEMKVAKFISMTFLSVSLTTLSILLLRKELFNRFYNDINLRTSRSRKKRNR